MFITPAPVDLDPATLEDGHTLAREIIAHHVPSPSRPPLTVSAPAAPGDALARIRKPIRAAALTAAITQAVRLLVEVGGHCPAGYLTSWAESAGSTLRDPTADRQVWAFTNALPTLCMALAAPHDLERDPHGPHEQLPAFRHWAEVVRRALIATAIVAGEFRQMDEAERPPGHYEDPDRVDQLFHVGYTPGELAEIIGDV